MIAVTETIVAPASFVTYSSLGPPPLSAPWALARAAWIAGISSTAQHPHGKTRMVPQRTRPVGARSCSAAAALSEDRKGWVWSGFAVAVRSVGNYTAWKVPDRKSPGNLTGYHRTNHPLPQCLKSRCHQNMENIQTQQCAGPIFGSFWSINLDGGYLTMGLFNKLQLASTFTFTNSTVPIKIPF